MSITVYGIKNCDTMKKAMTWLETQHIPYTFHDYKKQAITAADISSWIDVLGLDTVVNRKGTTWKKLDANVQANFHGEVAIQTLLAQPSLIKRPLVNKDQEFFVGFNPEQWASIFKK